MQFHTDWLNFKEMDPDNYDTEDWASIVDGYHRVQDIVQAVRSTPIHSGGKEIMEIASDGPVAWVCVLLEVSYLAVLAVRCSAC